MKMTYTITVASALVLAAGCAHDERSARTSEADYSSGRISQYNPSVGGSYSADGSYSSGGGGAYATPGGATYSGTVGADGSYIPFATAGALAAGGASAMSDDAVVAQVRETLRRDPEIALIVPNIQISAHNGAVILNGSVQSEEQKRQIMSRVQNVTGVVAVNNQMNVMAGSNVQNPNGLTPTGNSSDSLPLYKDAANGPDNSSNNALNSTSRQNGGMQIYQEGDSVVVTNSNGQLWQNGLPQNNDSSLWNTNNEMSPTSRTNSPNQIYHDSDQGQQQNNNSSTNGLSPTSRSGQSQIYQTNQGQNGQNSQEQNLNNTGTSTTFTNSSSSTLTPTSRDGGSGQIYQNNPGEKLPNQYTNSIQNP